MLSSQSAFDLVVGLGNPGAEYATTRHNVGWMILDQLVALWQIPEPRVNQKLAAKVGKKNSCIVCYPTTFMNDSGSAVDRVKRYFIEKHQTATLWVIHDDLDLTLGEWKLQFGRGPKQHNGLLSIYSQLGTDQFWHVRVGVDSRNGDRSIPGSAYVLQQLDLEAIRSLRSLSVEIARRMHSEGLQIEAIAS